MKKNFLIGFCLLIMIAAIIKYGAFWFTHNEAYEIEKITSVQISSDYPVADGLSQMTDGASIVVVGKYTGFNSKWNMARNPDNINQEDTENYTEGHLYNFVVDDVLKGNLNEDSITVNHRYARTVKITETNAVANSEGVIIKEATKMNNISFTVGDPLFIEPEIGVTYILFLLKDEVFDNYYGAVEPYSIKFTNDNVALLQSNLIDRVSDFKNIIEIDGTRSISVTTKAEYTIDDKISGSSLDSIISRIAFALRKW